MKAVCIAIVLFSVLSLIAQASPQAGPKKLKLTVFMESKCHHFRNAVHRSLGPGIEKGLLEMTNLEFVPYGNGKMARVPRKSRRLPRITCQHGPDECKGNVIDNCFLKYAKDIKTGLRAVVCFATKLPKTHWFRAMNFCSTKLGYN
jgi:interferon gamma-inducible protein 30